MKFEIEVQRTFLLWIRELESNGDWLQTALANAILTAFLAWYKD